MCLFVNLFTYVHGLSQMKRPTASIFDTNIQEKVFEKDFEEIFSKTDLFFKDFFLGYFYKLFFYFTID